MKSITSSTDRQQKPAHHSADSARNLAAAELLSFLKQTRAAAPWTQRDLAKTLNIGVKEAREALVIMQFEVYVASAGGPGNGYYATGGIGLRLETAALYSRKRRQSFIRSP